jgi:ribosome recycling factor
MDALKKLEKEKKVSEDDARGKSDQVQKATDEYIGKVDELIKHKEKEIMTV